MTFSPVQRIAAELKESTKKLCGQLQKKPAVEGNQLQVRNHKKELIFTVNKAIEEMEGEQLSFQNFANKIADQIQESHRYEKQKEQERELSQQITETTALYKKMQNDYSREQDENMKEMTELKRLKNEAQIEKDLNI